MGNSGGYRTGHNWHDNLIAVALLQVAVANGISYTRLSRIFRCSRSAISGAVRRNVHHKRDPRYGPVRQQRHSARWSEERLTERWSDRP